MSQVAEPLIIGRYEKTPEEDRKNWPEGCRCFADDWQGWIEPQDMSWISFIKNDGTSLTFLNRTESGAIID
jgi:hypothetical protein